MANISDIIEQFIIKTLGDDDSVDISRNELASFFSCAPSQINYVLATRFSNERGFEVFSQRGGGGYIKLSKIILDEESLIYSILNDFLSKPVDFNTAKKIIVNLLESDYFSIDEANIILSAITSKALVCPINFENALRAQILRNIIISKENKKNGGGEQNV